MKIVSATIGAYRDVCRKIASVGQVNVNAILLVVGFVLLLGGIVNLTVAQVGGGPLPDFETEDRTFNDFDGSLMRFATGNLLKLIEGAFGALIMVGAGLGAIAAASMGGYKAALGLLVVAVAAFILRSLISLFFGGGYDDYEVDG